MTTHRRRRRRALWPRAAGAAAVVAVVIALALFINGVESTGPDDGATGADLPSSAPSAFAAPSSVPSASRARPGSGTAFAVPDGPTITLGTNRGGLRISQAGKHRLTTSVTSSEPVYGVGYLIPTSLASPYGRVTDPGRSWSVHTEVSGRPYYAIVWIAAGRSGAPARCSISIDGKVVVSKATTGPFGRQVCYA